MTVKELASYANGFGKKLKPQSVGKFVLIFLFFYIYKKRKKEKEKQEIIIIIIIHMFNS